MLTLYAQRFMGECSGDHLLWKGKGENRPGQRDKLRCDAVFMKFRLSPQGAVKLARPCINVPPWGEGDQAFTCLYHLIITYRLTWEGCVTLDMMFLLKVQSKQVQNGLLMEGCLWAEIPSAGRVKSFGFWQIHPDVCMRMIRAG